MSEIEDLTNKIIKFRDERDWQQFHNPKDVALSLVLESAEVLEHFQWKSDDEMLKHIKENKEDVAEEIADVFYWVLLMSHDLEIDLSEALEKKMKTNKEKYPKEKAKGNHAKYTDL